MEPVAATFGWFFRPGSSLKGAPEPPRDRLGSGPHSGHVFGVPLGPCKPPQKGPRPPKGPDGGLCFEQHVGNLSIFENAHAFKAINLFPQRRTFVNPVIARQFVARFSAERVIPRKFPRLLSLKNRAAVSAGRGDPPKSSPRVPPTFPRDFF